MADVRHDQARHRSPHVAIEVFKVSEPALYGVKDQETVRSAETRGFLDRELLELRLEIVPLTRVPPERVEGWHQEHKKEGAGAVSDQSDGQPDLATQDVTDADECVDDRHCHSGKPDQSPKRERPEHQAGGQAVCQPLPHQRRVGDGGPTEGDCQPFGGATPSTLPSSSGGAQQTDKRSHLYGAPQTAKVSRTPEDEQPVRMIDEGREGSDTRLLEMRISLMNAELIEEDGSLAAAGQPSWHMVPQLQAHVEGKRTRSQRPRGMSTFHSSIGDLCPDGQMPEKAEQERKEGNCNRDDACRQRVVVEAEHHELGPGRVVPAVAQEFVEVRHGPRVVEQFLRLLLRKDHRGQGSLSEVPPTSPEKHGHTHSAQ
mmetsp:Transcript_92580/g.257883  ORF Transcript_92580/g.257883 Transcript_92580/m.257883 type:complete len:371 (+) Transcript_92580:499-1611(+)